MSGTLPLVMRFVALAILYAAPTLLRLFEANVALHTHAAALAMNSPPVVGELIANLTVHLTLVALLFAVVECVARRLSQRTGWALSLSFAAMLLPTWTGLVSANARWFGHSNYSVPLQSIATPAWLVVSTIGVLALCGWAYWPRRLSPAWPDRRSAVVVAVGCSVGVLAWAPVGHLAPGQTPANIILLGVDSLSWPMLEAEADRLPHLSALLAQATLHKRAYTPIGRTYPAWVSVLSGQSPAQHGALFNLRGLGQAKRDNLLTHSLHGLGYRTVYAIDERRFNNIDESFGFDAVVGPRPGALDFALQGLNDTPLTNLLLQTRLGAWLLPYSHLNVAAHASYDAQGFVDAIGRSLGQDQPVFLAVHLLSGHFPFKTRHATQDVKHPNPIRANHVEALTAVDQQVGALMDMLRRQGRLNDALVVLLSDHGEAVGEPEPYRDAEGRLVTAAGYGHGANLLSEHQNRIVLALARYQDGVVTGQGASTDQQVSLLDVRAAAERFANTGAASLAPGARCIPVETELRISAAEDYRHFDAGKVASAGASLYELDDRGRLVLREELLPALVRKKEVGWRCADRLTTFRPQDGRYRAYRLTDGEPPAEVKPLPQDVAAVDAYRARLLQSVGADMHDAGTLP
jgi:arylsulfatase A-like enzyme